MYGGSRPCTRHANKAAGNELRAVNSYQALMMEDREVFKDYQALNVHTLVFDIVSNFANIIWGCLLLCRYPCL